MHARAQPLPRALAPPPPTHRDRYELDALRLPRVALAHDSQRPPPRPARTRSRRAGSRCPAACTAGFAPPAPTPGMPVGTRHRAAAGSVCTASRGSVP
eukprot:366450-Chlamydomonas_euryale.AAC.43